MNTCESNHFLGKYIKHRRIVCYTKRIFICNQLLWNFFPTKSVYSTVASNNKRPLHSGTVIAALWERTSSCMKVTFGGLETMSMLGVQHRLLWLSLNVANTWARRASVCKGYLTVGVVVRRKWTGLEGRGGFMPRDGVCVGGAAPSALKVFISWATRPRPAEVDLVVVSSEAAPRDCSDAPVSVREKKKKKKKGSTNTSKN